MIQRFRQKQIGRKMYWLLLAGVVLARLAISFCQRVYLLPEGSGLDDMLMVRAAQSIAGGGWLGAYGGVAIAKNMGFAVWLWLLHTLHVPLLIGNTLLWLAACGFAARCLRPLFTGNFARVCLFAFLTFNPVSFAFYNQRVYRDAIFPAFCVLLFAGAVGLGLRLREKSLRGSVLCALGAGIGLVGGWLLREDGAVLLVFAVCALVLVAAFALWQKQSLRRAAKALLCAVPFALLGAGVLLFSAVNYIYYGVFMVNDLTSGSFPAAYSAMAGVSLAESGDTGLTPVSRDALERLLDEVPSLAPLRETLFTGAAYNGFADKETGQFGGSFYYAVRLAADYAGLTPDARTAQSYWAQVAAEIQQAVDEGRLQSTGANGSILPRFRQWQVRSTVKEAANGTFVLLSFADCDPRPQFSEGSEQAIAEAAAFVRTAPQTAYAEGTDKPFYSSVQKFVFWMCDAVSGLYALAIWPLLAVALWRQLRALAQGMACLVRQKRLPARLLPALLCFGLLCSLALRLVVAAYMEVAAFRVGTYIMYLSSAAPALLLFCAAGLCLPVQRGAGFLGMRDTATANPPRALGKQPFAQRFWQGGDATKLLLVLLAVAFVVIKIVLAGAQQVYLALEEAPIDDALMLRLAQSISAGNWLGGYDWLTLSKHSFFALWLAVLNALHVPYLLGGQLLWAGAAGLAAVAFAPVFKKRWHTLLLFCVLLFNPASVANPAPFAYITRVYRDNIFPALCVVAVAGMVGFALRYKNPLKRTVWWLVASGLGLCAAVLCREDGWWLVPFVLAAGGITGIYLTRYRPAAALKKGICLLLPALILAGGVFAWSGMNYIHYGRFIVSDFSGGEFADAYGAMTRVEHEDWNPKVAVPADVRQKLYENVPAMAQLAPLLESTWYRGRYALEDYSSGSFYWALREAVWELGYYETPQAAEAFYTELAAQINELCDNGTLAAGPSRSSVNPPIRAEYVVPVIEEAGRSLVFCAIFKDCEPYSLLSIPDEEVNTPAQSYLRETPLTAARAGTTQPYYSIWQSFRFRMLEAVRGVYSVGLPFALLAGLFMQLVGAVRMVKRGRAKPKRQNPGEALLWFVGLGLALCILLRVLMIAYVTVSSFMVDTYIMYLASVHPLMLLYGFLGVAMLVRWARESGFGIKLLRRSGKGAR